MAGIQFEDRLARFEMMTLKQTGLFKLGEYAIDGCETDVDTFGNEQSVNVFRGQVANFRILEQFKNFQPGEGGFEADALQVF